MRDEKPVGMPFFSIVARSASITDAALAFVDERRKRRVRARRVRGERMLGGDRAERHAHDRVGARREDVEAAVADQACRRRRGSSCGNAKRTPSLLPIQFACIVFTRSGQPGIAIELGEQLVGVVA